MTTLTTPTETTGRGTAAGSRQRLLRREDLMVVDVAEAAARLGGRDTAAQLGPRGQQVDLAGFVGERLEVGDPGLERELAGFVVVGGGQR